MNPFISSVTLRVNYNGSLRTTAIHEKSKKEIITDAPTDNNGKGESFSPTDMVAAALASCSLTIMGIVADKKGFSLPDTAVRVQKIMASDPRRIEVIKMEFEIDGSALDERQRTMLEKAARTCPVAKSLHSELKQSLEFQYR